MDEEEVDKFKHEMLLFKVTSDIVYNSRIGIRLGKGKEGWFDNLHPTPGFENDNVCVGFLEQKNCEFKVIK